jgi:hypothetical protein
MGTPAKDATMETALLVLLVVLVVVIVAFSLRS